MRTIEKIRRYTDAEIEQGKKDWIINGCGGQGWFNFDEMLDFFIEKVEKFEWYNVYKLPDLITDLRVLCSEHDLDFHYKKWFYKSNFIFAWGVARLIQNWTSFTEKIWVFILLFTLMNKYSKKYYLKCNK